MEFDIGVDAELAVCDAVLERRARVPDRGDVRLLPALGGERRGGTFEAGAELEAALYVGDGADRHETQDGGIRPPLHVAAGALPGDDDAVLAQPRKRLAHHRARRAEAARQ